MNKKKEVGEGHGSDQRGKECLPVWSDHGHVMETYFQNGSIALENNTSECMHAFLLLNSICSTWILSGVNFLVKHEGPCFKTVICPRKHFP